MVFLKARTLANLIFRAFEFSQTMPEHHENLPSSHCQKGIKKKLLKFSKLFPHTFLKWICLTKISLVIFLAKLNEAIQSTQQHLLVCRAINSVITVILQ